MEGRSGSERYVFNTQYTMTTGEDDIKPEKNEIKSSDPSAEIQSSATNKIPLYTDSETLTAFKKFFAIPIVEVVKGFMHGQYDGEQLVMRMEYPTTVETQALIEWFKNNLSSYECEDQDPDIKNRFGACKQLLFGIATCLGLGSKANLRKARKYFYAAADQGSSWAYIFLAHREKNEDRVEDFYKQAISKDNGYAEYCISLLYKEWNMPLSSLAYKSSSIEKEIIRAFYDNAKETFTKTIAPTEDLQKAKKQLYTAARMGYVPALILLGDLYTNGNYFPEDHKRAAQYYHYAFIRECNEYKTETNVRTGAYKIINLPLSLFNQNSESLFICYQLAKAISDIKSKEIHKTFKSTFNNLVEKNFHQFVAICFSDDIEGIAAAVKWLNKESRVLLAMEFNLINYFLTGCGRLPAELMVDILTNAFGVPIKNKIELGDEILRKEIQTDINAHKKEKEARIISHLFNTFKKTYVPKKPSAFGFFPHRVDLRNPVTDKRKHYNVERLNQNIFAADKGKISYREALNNSKSTWSERRLKSSLHKKS